MRVIRPDLIFPAVVVLFGIIFCTTEGARYLTTFNLKKGVMTFYKMTKCCGSYRYHEYLNQKFQKFGHQNTGCHKNIIDIALFVCEL